jgi:hypothetical protein
MMANGKGSASIQYGFASEKIITQSLSQNANIKIKKYSRLKGQFEKLLQDTDWQEFEPLTSVINKLIGSLEKERSMVDFLKRREKAYRSLYYFDKALNKPTKKQGYWNHVIIPALKLINNYCHNNHCTRTRQCSITHATAYYKIAELLKILYPSIWTESIKTISNQIKSREQRI